MLIFGGALKYIVQIKWYARFAQLFMTNNALHTLKTTIMETHAYD